MRNTKIDWCDSTLNFVIGCPNGCEYCYARKLNKRFRFVENWDKPEFFPERVSNLKGKGRSIFMDSMSDFGTWSMSNTLFVENSMVQYPQHAYIFLTKTSKYFKTWDCLGIPRQKNWFFGRTYTQGKVDPKGRYDFLSIEPIHNKVEILNFNNLKQVIIGAETGNRSGKIIPEKEWVLDLVKQCDQNGVKVFMKSSLCEIMGSDFRQDKLIWQEFLENK